MLKYKCLPEIAQKFNDIRKEVKHYDSKKH